MDTTKYLAESFQAQQSRCTRQDQRDHPVWRDSYPAMAGQIEQARQSQETRRVLFICYSFPPSMDVGANSCAQIARYLPMYGWQPVVLTVKEKYFEKISTNHKGPREGAAEGDSDLIIRTNRFLHPFDIYRRFKANRLTRRLFREGNKRRSALNAASQSTSPGSPGSGGAIDFLLAMLSVPDMHTGWLIPAVAAGLRAIRRTNAQAIYSSAPYFTAHLAGYALARLTGLPWMAHFRDPWITGLLAGYSPNNLHFRLCLALEQMTVRLADAVVCVTEEHAALMRAAYDQMPASKFVVVMNGFDGLEWKEAAREPAPDERRGATTPRKFRITYAGSLYMKRNPAPLFWALRTLIDAGEIGREEVTVELIGWCEESEGRSITDLISESGVESLIEMPGPLDHLSALRRLSQSDLLLLLAEELKTQIPGKTFEYLKTRRPILALTREGAVATLLRKTGGAWVVDPDDQAGVINAIRECHQFWKRGLPARQPDPLIVESFDRRKTTGRIADLLSFFVK